MSELYTSSELDGFFDVLVSDAQGRREPKDEIDRVRSMNTRYFPPPHTADLELLQEMPRYLSDAILSSELPVGVVGPDHYSYWGWTAAVMSFLQDDYGMMRPGVSSEFESSVKSFRDILSDYFSLVYLMILPIHHREMDGRMRAFVSSMNPSAGKLHEMYTLRFAGSSGFQLLEGLLRRHSEHIQIDGTPEDASLPIPAPWTTSANESTVEISAPDDFLSYEDELHIWREYAESQIVHRTLNLINDLQRDLYKEDDTLEKLGTDEDTRDEIRRQYGHTGNFLSIVSKRRNHNLHGRGSSQRSGILMMNLCCLLLWDAISGMEYEQVRHLLLTRKIYTSITDPMRRISRDASTNDFTHRRSTMSGNRFGYQKPADFYPIYLHQKANISTQAQEWRNEQG